MPVLLTTFLQHLSELTGWMFMAVAAGPLPSANGKVYMNK